MRDKLKKGLKILHPITAFFILFLFLISCSGDSSNPSDNTRSDGALPGDPKSLAINATYDFNPETGNPQEDIEDDPRYGKIVRTIIEIGFSKEGTVGEVNSLIDSIDGKIINMLEGVAIIIVRIPDPGTMAALENIIQEVESNSIVRFAGMGHIPSLSALPDNYTYDHTDLTKIDHNLAVRGHAAWNVRAALQNTDIYSPTLVIVPDTYGKGTPVSDYGFDITGSDFLTGAADPSEHGYHVIGVIGADYGGAENDRGWATGLYPAVSPSLLPLRVIDQANGLTREQVDDILIELIKEKSGQNIVVNTSLGFSCGTQDDVDKYCSQENAEEEALKWIEKVRDAGVEEEFVHVTAGGNSYVAGDNEAKFASQYSAAKLLTGLEDCWLGVACTSVENISNALVVENQMNSANVPYQPICLYHESKIGGDVSAIGTKVWSLYDPSATAGDSLNGTSIASPQVAALAAYVWALNPTLNNQEVINILKNSSRDAASWDPTLSSECRGEHPSPIIDAYAAVLSVDTPSNAKIRKLLLDVADDFGGEVGDGVFNENDISLMLAMLGQEMPELDYSRYDLNGDGYTGGDTKERFDLDINNPPAFTSVDQDIDGTNTTFDEMQLTDMDILCYYGYSDLYAGDLTARHDMLYDKCIVPCQITINEPVICDEDSGDTTLDCNRCNKECITPLSDDRYRIETIDRVTYNSSGQLMNYAKTVRIISNGDLDNPEVNQLIYINGEDTITGFYDFKNGYSYICWEPSWNEGSYLLSGTEPCTSAEPMTLEECAGALASCFGTHGEIDPFLLEGPGSCP